MSHAILLPLLTPFLFPAAELAAPPSARVAILPPALSPAAAGPGGGALAATTDDWTAIDALPFTITEAGGYYLAKNLTGVPGADGVVVSASDVVIDLNGFTLAGAPGSLDGIRSSGPDRVRVRNGTISAWGGDGVDLALADRSAVEDVRSADNGAIGLRLGNESRVERCLAARNGSIGVLLAFAGRVERTLASENGGDGIQLGERGQVTGCQATNNAEDGIQVNVAIVRGCHATSNGAHGVFALTTSEVVECVSYRNSGDGIRLGVGCLASANVCSQNGVGAAVGAGIRVTGNQCRVDGNQVNLNDTGIEVTSSGNLVVRNSAAQNGAGGQNFVVVAGNSVGPVVTGATIATSTNPHANYAP